MPKATEESNRIARNNAHAELRAYVSLGDRKGQWIAISKTAITLFFFNAGRTPARHFFAQFDLSGKGMPIRHIGRTAVIGGPEKGAIITEWQQGSDITGSEVATFQQTKTTNLA